MKRRLSILLVDDSVAFLDSAMDHLARDVRVEVVGRAQDGMKGVRLAKELAPDVILMDLTMAVINPMATVGRIKAWPDSPRVVLVSQRDHPEFRYSADAMHADGFICKSDFSATLPTLIDALVGGSPVAAAN